jgi:hypothetical protein
MNLSFSFKVIVLLESQIFITNRNLVKTDEYSYFFTVDLLGIWLNNLVSRIFSEILN